MNSAFKILTFVLWIILTVSLLYTSSSTIILIVLGWAIIVSIIFYFLIKKNKPNLPKPLSLADHSSHLYSWTEIVSSENGSNSRHLFKQRMYSDEELNSLSSSELLSYGVNLYTQGMINQAVGIFRLVIERPDASPLLVQVAECRLHHLLQFSGTVGQKIVSGLGDGG